MRFAIVLALIAAVSALPGAKREADVVSRYVSSVRGYVGN